jgi:probable addiction module antidote protein
LYYTRHGEVFYLLLLGGDESSQRRDVKRAIAMAPERQARETPMTKLAPFDAADYLTDEETIAEYLNAASENPDPDLFLVAVRDVARARGMTQLAKDTGPGRESLYEARAPGAQPRFDTITKIMHALGLKLPAVSGRA